MHTLDGCGLQCPQPGLHAKRALRDMASAERLRVLCTDPASVRDFDAFSRKHGHALLCSTERDGTYVFLIEKG